MCLGVLGPDGFLQPDTQSLPMLLCHDHVTFLIGLTSSQSIILSKRTINREGSWMFTVPSFPVNNIIGLAGASLRQVLDWRVLALLRVSIWKCLHFHCHFRNGWRF